MTSKKILSGGCHCQNRQRESDGMTDIERTCWNCKYNNGAFRETSVSFWTFLCKYSNKYRYIFEACENWKGVTA